MTLGTMFYQPVIDCIELILRLACLTSGHSVLLRIEARGRERSYQHGSIESPNVAVGDQKNSGGQTQSLEVVPKPAETTPIYKRVVSFTHMNMSCKRGPGQDAPGGTFV